MLQSRRGFLIGAGAVLTTAFVKDAHLHYVSRALRSISPRDPLALERGPDGRPNNRREPLGCDHF
jgi:hypothetical protein